MHRKQRQRIQWTLLTIAFIFFGTIGFTLFSLYDVKHDQAEQYEELNRALEDITGAYQQEIRDVQMAYDQKLESMGEFVIDTREEYDSRAQDLLNLVEETEQKNNVELAELREELNNHGGDFTKLVNKVLKASVSVSTNSSQGSGTVITRDGFMVTNNHVVKGYSEARIIGYDGKVGTARVIAADPVRDLAILKSDSFHEHLEPGDSDQIMVGERVMAIGSPQGLDFTVTQGIVSAASRVFDEDEGSFIQTDVPINTGSSGGPLINSKGEIIGVNTFKIKDSESLGFSIPSNDVKKLLIQARNIEAQKDSGSGSE